MPDLTPFLQRPFAHRGLFDQADRPENSLAAMEAAVAAGYGVELDVRLSRDGQAVVFHDADLRRLTGVDGLVAERTAAELAGLRLRGSGQGIPRLAEVLTLVAGRVPLYVEIKHEAGDVAPLARQVRQELAAVPGDYVVGSFHPEVTAWFRQQASAVARCRIACRFGTERHLDPATKAFLADLGGLDHDAPHMISWGLFDFPDAKVARLRAAGMPVLAWTVRTPADLAVAREHADNYVFEGMAPEGSMP